MRSALVNLNTGLVENLLMADPAIDQVQDGYVLLPDPPDRVDIGTPWDGSQFILPPPEPPPDFQYPKPAAPAGLETL